MSKHNFREWFLATRPWSFTASSLTVVAALAYLADRNGGIDWISGLWAVAAIILFHAAGNTWSDWCDFRKGVDTDDTHGSDTLTSGRFSPAEIRNFSLCLFVAACAAGLGLLLRTGLPLLWIGLGGLFCALCYPPLKYHALGDLVIFMAYGFLPAIGTSYVATGGFDWSVLWMALPVSLLVDAILHSNNTRDMLTDKRASATTLAHFLGVRGSVALYIFETLFPFVWVTVLVPFGIFPPVSLAVLLLLPVAFGNAGAMRAFRGEGDAAAIAGLDQLSAKLQMLFCIVMSLTLLIDLWIL